jgi:uncharacterized membrane protein YeaQ/YmgE (transglycosylase-associated protein family)
VHTHITHLWKRLAAGLSVGFLWLMVAPAPVLATIPNVKPNTSFEGSKYGSALLDILCGAILLVLVALALISIVAIVNAVRSSQGSVGKPIAGFIGAVIAIIIVSNFTPFLNGLTHSVGG